MDTNTLANALKSVFGNNTTDNPSSSSKIPYCGSDGLPAGLASMGNLASVLGVNKVITGGFNCDELETGFYYYTEGGSNAPATYAWIITLAGGSDKAQLAWTVEKIFTRRRSGGYWNSWKTY